MSHVEQGPLASYNSLVDGHLAGYFSNTRMRRHLRKAGLITKQGEIVSENTYRLNMSRKEHKKHVKDMLAQAIVHKTLDLERTRQAEIRKKFEEIAKIELVRRVRASEKRKREQDLLPYLSPRTASRPSSSSTGTNGTGRRKYKYRATSAPSRKGRRPMSALSSNYDEDDEEVVVYLDDEGRPITPAHVDEAELRYSSKDPIDTRHLYSLDTAALRKYAMLMAQMEQGRGVTSPYVIPQVPLPPKSPKSSRSPRSAQRYRGGHEGSKSSSPKRPATALHPAGSPKRYPGQQETMCEVDMRYHGSTLSLAREQFDKRQDIVVEQQHCGGNTLTVFRDKLEPDTKFSFISYRHRGYPFSLTIYIDGKMDCRVSTCCEYRHQRGGRIGGKNGHFSITKIAGAIPCYKCQVEKGIKGRQAPRRKLKRPPQHEEVIVLQKEEPRAKQEEEKKEEDKYESDFESSSSDSEQEEVRNGLEAFQPKDARGVDKTTGKVDINDVSSSESQSSRSDSESDSDDDRKRRRKAKKRPTPIIAREEPKTRDSRGKADVKKAPPAPTRGSAPRPFKERKVAKAEEKKPLPVEGSSAPAPFREIKKVEVEERTEVLEMQPVIEVEEEQDAVQEVVVVNEKADLSTAPRPCTAPHPYMDVKVEKAQEETKEEKKKEEFEFPRFRSMRGPVAEVKQEEKKRRGSTSSRSSADSSSSSSSSTSGKDYSDSENDTEKRGGKKSDEKKVEAVEEERTTVTEVQIKDVSQEKTYGVPVGGITEEAEEEQQMRWSYQGPTTTAVEKDASVGGVDDDSTAAPVPSSSSPPPPAQNEVSFEEGAAVEIQEKSTDHDSGESEEVVQPPPTTATPPPSPAPQTVVAEVSTQEVVEGEAQEKSPDYESEAQKDEVEEETKQEYEIEEQEPRTQGSAPAPFKSLGRRGSASSSSSSASSSSSSSYGSVAISDKGPNLLNDPTAVAEVKQGEEEEKKEQKQEGRQLPVIIADDQVEKDTSVEKTVVAKENQQQDEKGSKSDDDSSSDSSSDSENSSSDSSDSNTREKAKSQSQTSNMEMKIQTTADVHHSEPGRTKTEARHDQDSDPEATHGGNDPDNVANDLGGTMTKPVPSVAPPQSREGSILPLLQQNQATLEVKGVTLNKTQVYEAASYLETKGGINHVNLVNCGMDDDDVQKIGEALKASPSEPVLLNLSLNPLSSGCVDHILDILHNKPSIEAVLLQGTRLGDDGVEKLVNGILDLHREKIEELDDGVSPKELKELRELDLSDSKIGDEGARSVAGLIRSDMDIDTLTLSSNHAVSSEGWRFIGEALRKNQNLETLTLDHNFIGDEGVQYIAEGLHNNRSVTALDLNDVGMTEKGGRYVVELLKRNINILEITLMGNKLSEQMKEEIEKYISLNKTVVTP